MSRDYLVQRASRGIRTGARRKMLPWLSVYERQVPLSLARRMCHPMPGIGNRLTMFSVARITRGISHAHRVAVRAVELLHCRLVSVRLNLAATSVAPFAYQQHSVASMDTNRAKQRCHEADTFQARPYRTPQRY